MFGILSRIPQSQPLSDPSGHLPPKGGQEILKRKNGPEFLRVQFNEITRNAVRAAFDHPGHVDMQLVDSQQARRILDRIVGYKISPLLNKRVARGLSAGATPKEWFSRGSAARPA